MSSHSFLPAYASFGSGKIPKNTWSHEMNYDGFKIESFEAGKGLWHARIRRLDQKPVVIDGVLFSALEVGFAWSDPDAISDCAGQLAAVRNPPGGPAHYTRAGRARALDLEMYEMRPYPSGCGPFRSQILSSGKTAKL